MNRIVTLLALLTCFGFASSANAIICIDQAAFDGGNTVWGDVAAEDEVVVTETLFVRGGRTLEILPGVVVRGLPRLDGAASSSSFPGSVVVTRSGKIDAQGTPNSPIIFTTAALDEDGTPNEPDRSAADPAYFERWDCTGPRPTFYDDDPHNSVRPPLALSGINNVQMWGGLVMLGNGPTNLDCLFCADGADFGEGIIEGLTTAFFSIDDIVYGGQVPNDNSGTVRYVQIRHGGDEIGVANEINGLTMGALGSGTTLEYIEVYSNFDDGYEWFGGTVNAKGLVSTLNGDDQFDTDQGYTGTVQLLYALLPFADATTLDPRQGDFIFGSESGDKGWEADGDDLNGAGTTGLAFADSIGAPVGGGAGDYAAYPGRAHFATFYNATILSHDGITSPNFTPTAAANGTMIMRNGFGGNFINIIMGNMGSAAYVNCLSTRYAGYNCVENSAKTKVTARSAPVRIVSSTFYGGTFDGSEVNALARGDEMDAGTDYDNVTGGFGGMVQDDYTFAPTGTASGFVDATLLGKGPVVPIPSGSFGYSFGQDSGPEAGINYRGAFAAGVDEWTDGWTVLSISGLQ